ncbi:MAG TPA: 2OG-Fe dioxygenase family protein [Burkholderiaceae bacterium]|nr:2OG-Fe dioxygenase family protein [Burkholderiaceae bacterium]
MAAMFDEVLLERAPRDERSKARGEAPVHDECLHPVAAQLRGRGFCPLDAGSLCEALNVDLVVWRRFADCWNRLTLDRFMGDGGTYRFRRYGQFMLDRPDGPLTQLPHGPYEQSSDINPLNGGIKRYFDPLEPGFVASPFFDALVRFLAVVFDAAQRRRGAWNIRAHPYRIRASGYSEGRPTPEGMHRDGVDYVISLMVRRHNVQGGETHVTDNEGSPLFSHTLTAPMECLLEDDARTRHGVTPVHCIDERYEAYRDVLVLAYTRP